MQKQQWIAQPSVTCARSVRSADFLIGRGICFWGAQAASL
jgi:hypothetical protein